MTNRKWNISLIVLFIIFACLLTSFLFSSLRIRELVQPLISSTTADHDARRRVVLISQELDNPYWRSIEQGARAASADFNMNIEYDGPFRIHSAEQIRLLEKAISKKADAILLQGMDNPAYKELIDKATAIGIPVITLDTDEPGSSRLVYVGTDNHKAGIQMGELIVQASGGQGYIGVLVGDEQAPNQQHRLEGFRSVINRHPGLTIAEVRSSHISRLQAASQTEEMLLHNSHIRYLVGFSALDGLGMLEGAKRLPEQEEELHIFAFDDLEETMEGIAQGKIKATIVQQPYEMGYAAVSLLQDYFDGKILPEQRFTAAYMIDQSTVYEASGADGP